MGKKAKRIMAVLVSIFVLSGTASPVRADAAKQNIYRLYNPNNGEHFYTASVVERDHLTAIGWNYEGVGWTAPAYSGTPVYRLYNPNAGDHHYTTSMGERDHLVSCGWNYEGIGWYSDDAKTIPVYRNYNPNAVTGTHNFSTSVYEYRHLCGCGWYAEDIAWYGVPKEGKTAGQTLLENGDFWEDEGTSGRLYIPSQDFSVALYACNSDGSNANGIIYPWDAAGDLSPYWGNIIADHFYQGFDVIKRCRPGDACYIVNNGQVREYHMTLQDKNGINTGYHLQLSDGTNIEQSRDGIWMYTCNGYAKESGITITHWE